MSNWKDSSSSVEKGWEDSFGIDIDDNGLITGGNYKIATSAGAIEITTKKGASFDDDSNAIWNASAAVETANGYEVLLEGEKGKSGQVKVWKTNKQGVLTQISDWQDAETFLAENDNFSSVSLPEYFESDDSLESQSLGTFSNSTPTDVITGANTSSSLVSAPDETTVSVQYDQIESSIVFLLI